VPGSGAARSRTLAAGRRPREARRHDLGGGRGPRGPALARHPAPPCHPLRRRDVTRRIVVGISGASGAIYGIRMLQALEKIKDVETHLIVSTGAKATIAYETSWKVEDVVALADVVHDERDLAATLASGSFQTHGMVVAPCRRALAVAKLFDMHGHISVREGDVTYVNGHSASRMAVTPEEIAIVRIADGTTFEGTPPSEIPIHLLLYRTRPDVGAIVHFHA